MTSKPLTASQCGLYGEVYKKAYLVKSVEEGGTKAFKDQLKALGGKFTIIQQVPCWMFYGSMKDQVDEWLNKPMVATSSGKVGETAQYSPAVSNVNENITPVILRRSSVSSPLSNKDPRMDALISWMTEISVKVGVEIPTIFVTIPQESVAEEEEEEEKKPPKKSNKALSSQDEIQAWLAKNKK